MKRTSLRHMLSFVLAMCITHTANAKDLYFHSLSERAILSSIIFFGQHAECLRNEEDKSVCTKNNIIPSKNFIVNSITVDNEFKIAYKKIYKKSPPETRYDKLTNLEEARERFISDAAILERKLIIAFLVSDRECGKNNPEIIEGSESEFVQILLKKGLLLESEKTPADDSSDLSKFKKKLTSNITRKKINCDEFVKKAAFMNSTSLKNFYDNNELNMPLYIMMADLIRTIMASLILIDEGKIIKN